MGSERGRSPRVTRSASAALVLAGLSVLACVSDAHEAMTEARARYEQCLAAASERECVAEKERMLAAERSYQETAQRAWGCDPTQPDCPPRR
jgi:uncharacterized membrane protein